VILTLAFGVGLTTTAFAALYKIVLNPVPFRDPDQLVVVRNRFPAQNLNPLGASPFDYRDLQARGVFENIGGYYFYDLNRTGIERPEKINAIAVTGTLFSVLGVTPKIGRSFDVQEAAFGGPHAVIISDSYWRSEFAADPAILQRSLQLNGENYPVIGVMPASFTFPNEVTQMWVPLAFGPGAFADPLKASYYLRNVARLKPGATFEQTSAQVRDLVRQWAADAPPGSPRAREGWELFLVPMAADNDGSLGRWITILFAAVCCLVVTVCANVGGLLLVRSRERRLDLAVRIAMGASRLRIATQVWMEVLLLAAIGGALGLLLSVFSTGLIGTFGPAGTLRIDGFAILFAIGLTVITGFVCGAYPVLSAIKLTAIEVASGARATRRNLWQRGFIVAQIGTATMLMITGALLIQSLTRLLATPLGFDPTNVTTLQISLPPQRYVTRESRAAFWQEFVTLASAIPGVESVSTGSLLPFGYGENVNFFEVVGRPNPAGGSVALINNVRPRYFETLRIALLRGRYIDERDFAANQKSVVIDQSLAARYFPGEDPIGQKIKAFSDIYTIVGVVGSVKVSSLNDEPHPALYFAAGAFTDFGIVMRTSPGAGGVVNAVRSIVAGIDKDQPIYDVLPMEATVERSVRTRRILVRLMGIFASAGTAMAAFGLYGLLSYTIATRRKEIGIRMAVGADARTIASLICRGGLALIVTGIAAGSIGALASEALVASQLYGIRFTDTRTWAAVMVLIVVTGLAACAIPAWRATQVNPVDVLNSN
jgi:putative ABC transport system permease protein